MHRPYRTEGLSLRHKRSKRNRSVQLRALTIIDNCTRECLAIEVGQSLNGEEIVRTLERIIAGHCWLGKIKADNNSEFIYKATDHWLHDNCMELDCSQLGKPTYDAKVEFFSRRQREEYLNAHWFMSLDDAKRKVEAWQRNYNGAPPPYSDRLGYAGRIRPPMQAAARIGSVNGAGNFYL